MTCQCGHSEDVHDPRLPGCVECICRRFRHEAADATGQTCGHVGRDYTGACFGCTEAERIRAIKAQAWDEGFKQARVRRDGGGQTGRYEDNPYRADHDSREEADKGARAGERGAEA